MEKQEVYYFESPIAPSTPVAVDENGQWFTFHKPGSWRSKETGTVPGAHWFYSQVTSSVGRLRAPHLPRRCPSSL